MRYSKVSLTMAFGSCLLISDFSLATTIGSDSNLKFSQTAGGMAGAGYARPQDAVASVFGNPASLTQLNGNTDFTFGASYLNVGNDLTTDGSVMPVGSGSMEAEHYLLPTMAVRQRLTDKAVFGLGFQAVGGLGSDYRTSQALDPTVTYLNFGANMDFAYAISPKTSVGVAMTLAYGVLEVGLISTTAIQETFGVRGGLGLTHDLGPVMLSVNYNSELEMEFNDVIQSDTSGNYSDFTLEQPQEVILGIASTPAMWENLLIEADVIYKNWDNATGYKDIWKDTFTLQLGSQYTLNKLQFRAGYSYTTDLRKDSEDLGNSISGLSTLNVGGATTPVGPAVLQFVTASLAHPFWNHNVTVGIGYEINSNLRADAQAGIAFGDDQSFGGNKTTAEAFTVGAGLSWSF
tara:strand:- start:24847 stop:26058 length:1212 start_codon:yes stop_codon:yes gene_type:complete